MKTIGSNTARIAATIIELNINPLFKPFKLGLMVCLAVFVMEISASQADNVIMTNVSLNGVNAVINDIEVFQGNPPGHPSSATTGYHLELLDGSGNILFSTYYEYNFFQSVTDIFQKNLAPVILDSSVVKESIIIPYLKGSFAIKVTSPSGNVDMKILPKNKIGLPVTSKRFKPVSPGSFHIVIIPSLFAAGSEIEYYRAFVKEVIDFFFLVRPFNEYSRSQIQFHVIQDSQDIEDSMAKVYSAAAKSGYFYDEIITIRNQPYIGGVGSLQWNLEGDTYTSLVELILLLR